MAEVATKVKEIIMEKLGTSEDKVTPEASFRNDLGADSLSTVELMMELEEAFGVDIEDEEAEKIETVKDAIEYIENKLAEKAKE
jgi:acyl carrier protein